MINRKQLAKYLAERNEITYQDAEQICKSTFELLGALLYENKEDVAIQGFGTFKHKKAKAKKVRHPGSGDIITMPERDFVKFTPSQLIDIK